MDEDGWVMDDDVGWWCVAWWNTEKLAMKQPLSWNWIKLVGRSLELFVTAAAACSFCVMEVTNKILDIHTNKSNKSNTKQLEKPWDPLFTKNSPTSPFWPKTFYPFPSEPPPHWESSPCSTSPGFKTFGPWRSFFRLGRKTDLDFGMEWLGVGSKGAFTNFRWFI